MSTIINVFVSPGAAFRKLKEKPAWLPALIVVVVLLCVGTYVGVSRMDYSALKDRVAEQMRNQGLSEDQIQQRLDASDRIMNNPVSKYAVPILTVIATTVVGFLIVAGVLMLMTSLLGITGAKYALNLAVVTHAALVRIIAVIVRTVVALLGGNEAMSFGLSLLAPNLKGGYLASLLARIDVFSIWEVILLALGMKVVYDLKDNRSYVYLLILWLAFVALSSLLPGGGLGAR